MREIKFRGLTENGEWIYGSLINWKFHAPDIFDNKNYKYEVISNTVGQYTEIKDKNKEEIFEDDIIFSDGEYWWVYFNYEFGQWRIDNKAGADKCLYPNSRSEIVGNIYDNPDLFKRRTHEQRSKISKM